jgi:two-component system CheB/CheR fusion protein
MKSELQQKSILSDEGAGAAVTNLDASESDSTPPAQIPRDGTADVSAPMPSIIADPEAQNPKLSYPVVAFGASAGGLQALKEILQSLKTDTGMSFVVVTHLAADQRSYLTEITSQFTAMSVGPIIEGQKPEPNSIHVLLPNQIARLSNGVFTIQSRASDGKHPMVIDTFFRSLAADQKNHSVGVVLSGADSDGASGLKAIKGEGGFALVQTPESAQHSSMPRMSIAADHVDLVVPPRELAAELNRLGEQFARPEVKLLEQADVPLTDEQSFARILQCVRTSSGLDLRQYKPDTIRRRIARRMVLLRMDSLAQYLRFLQLRSDELKILQEDVLINVTRFFRDPAFWHALSAEVLPAFFRGRPTEKPIRIWCAGCSSGEEVYSLAVTLIEYLIANGLETTVQIFGTDISERSIEMARNAVYPESLAAEINHDQLRRFFVKVDRGYQVSKRVRDCCIFARQNLAADPPFSHIDFLTCRNVLIYFNETLQKQIIATFHYALNPDGYMLLGLSETLRDHESGFAIVDRKQKIYQRKEGGPGVEARLPLLHTLLPLGIRATDIPQLEDNWPDLELQRAADRIVLSRFGPPGLIVDDKLNVLQARGQNAPYVELSSGAVSWNLHRIVRSSIGKDVVDAVERSIRENIPVSRASTLKAESGDQAVQVDVLPIGSSGSRTRCFMVLFSNVDDARTVRTVEQPRLPDVPPEERDRINLQLREDLSSTRFHLQSLIEERDARNQELVSANEEIQSANEELQSTNEELETTKEELQSANEELQTVNDELQQRNSVLTQTGNDLTNLLTSVNIPLLMLTDNFTIRQFTPPMEKLLNVRSTDVGRPIGEIRLQLSIEDIQPILSDVLETLGTREVEVQDKEGRWHLMRIRPYRTSDNKIEGLVLVLVDIDQLRSSQSSLREARDFASSVVEGVPIPVVVLKKDCTVRTANTAFCELTRTSEQANLGQSFPDLIDRLWGVDGIREKLGALLTSEAGTTIEFEHESTTSDQKVLLFKAQAQANDGDRVILLTIEDITLRRRAEKMLAQQKNELEAEVDRTKRTLSAAQEELRDLTAHLFSVQEEERQRVARELHDDVAQRLSLLQIQLEPEALASGESGSQHPGSVYEQIRQLNADVRTLSHKLHPAILIDLGLPAALKELVDHFSVHEQMFATYIGTNVPEQIPIDAATVAYRIAQEALRNVSKHAGKTHVKIMLEGVDDLLRLEVRDLGVGFDTSEEQIRRGLGLVSMKERARIAGGSLQLTSALGEGTTVALNVPLNGHE